MMPALRFCAYGTSDQESDWPALFADTPGLEYLGPFQEFAALQPDGYDALLYTSAFDGLPNVILEAMGWGLPVIAPDVGWGIGGGSGWGNRISHSRSWR